jgi:uncharacterized protein (DUF885 family)
MIENSARFAIAPLALLLALLPVRAPAQTYHDEVQKFFQSYFETRLRDYPEFATDTGHYENAGKWSDWSKPGRELRRRHAEEALSAADKFSTDSLPDSDQVSLRLLKYNLRLQLDAEDLEMHLLRVAQVFGLHNSAYITVDRMPGRTVRDYENILARLHGLPAYVDQNIDLLNESIARGLTQPRVVVDLVIKQVQAQTAQDSATTPLLAAFRRFPSNVPPDQQKKLHDEAVAAYEEEFLPAWKKLLTFFQTTYAPKARPDIGLSSLPGGREDYAILVRRQTTTNASPEEIHKIGEAEVQRLEAEMLAVARETGFAGTLSEFDKKLGDTPESSRISQVLRQRGVRRRLGALRGRARRAARLVQGSLQPLRAPRHGTIPRCTTRRRHRHAHDGLVARASPRLRECAPAASFVCRLAIARPSPLSRRCGIIGWWPRC